MTKSEQHHGAEASSLISERIAELADWRGETLSRMRALILEADAEIVEEWKWTFAKGAALDDPKGLFNASLDGNVRRAIDIAEGEVVNATAFKALIRRAVAFNRASKAKSAKKAKG